MGGIFISYRKEDSSGWAGRIYDHLSARLGEDQLFIDMAAIRPGEDFAEAIEDILDRVEMVLVVIGPAWLDVRNEGGQRRLYHPKDFVRREIAGALRRDCRLVPVLVGGASMPAQDDLPKDISDFAMRNAVSISDARFGAEMDALISTFREDSTAKREEPSNSLPLQHTRFVGRVRELQEAGTLLQENRIVTISGPGGSGKTRLAVEAARRALSDYPDGVWFVDLASLRDPDLIPTEVANAIGLGRQIDTFGSSLAEALADLCALIVLDNCEHLLPSASLITADLLQWGPDLTILATSRHPLRVPGEAMYQVPHLSTPPEGTDVARVHNFDAIRLFEDRAALVRGSGTARDQLEDVAALCRKLEGSPLAIELAASRAGSLSPRAILEGLDATYRILGSGPFVKHEHQRSLNATIQWSYQLLEAGERVFLNRLSVFAGFDIRAARSVCSFGPITDDVIPELVGGLVEKSLVQAETGGRDLRYRLLEVVRSYAKRKLEKSGESERTRQLHAKHYLELARQSNSESQWFQVADRELDNFRTAMAWALEEDEPEVAQVMIGRLFGLYLGRHRAREGLDWAEKALAASEEPTSARAWAFLAAGSLGGPTEYLDEAITISRVTGDTGLLANALQNLAFETAEQGDWDKAEEIYRELAEIQSEGGKLSGRAGVVFLMLSSDRALNGGNFPEAVSKAKEALEVAEGYPRLTDLARLSLINAYRMSGNLEDAEAALHAVFEDELGIATDYNRGLFEVQSAVVKRLRHQDEEAARLYDQAVKRILGVPDPASDGRITDWVLWQGAYVLHLLGDSSTAAKVLGAADAYLNSIGHVRPKWESEEFGSLSSQIRAAVGEKDYQDCIREGGELDPEQALKRLSENLGYLAS